MFLNFIFSIGKRNDLLYVRSQMNEQVPLPEIWLDERGFVPMVQYYKSFREYALVLQAEKAKAQPVVPAVPMQVLVNWGVAGWCFQNCVRG